MSDDLREVESVLEAMRHRGEACPAAPPSDFLEVQGRMRRIRQKQLVERGAIAGAAFALAAGVAALVVVYGGSDASAGRPPGPSSPPVVAGAPPSPVAPALTRLELSADLVVFADAAAKISFPSPERMILEAGTAALRLRPAGGGSLTIETPAAKVVVTGTVVSVSVEPAGTGVEVLRGHVRMLVGPRTLELGERQRVAAGAMTAEPLPDDRVARLVALFPEDSSPALVASTGPAVAPAEPVPPPVAPTATDVRPSSPAGAQPTTPPPGESSLDEAYRAVETAMRDGRYVEAAELLRGILARVPEGSSREETALFDLAQVCEQAGDLGCRREALEKYLERHPSGAMREDARLGLCRVLQRTGTAAELRSCLESYLAEFPNARKADWARELLGASLPAPSAAPENGR